MKTSLSSLVGVSFLVASLALFGCSDPTDKTDSSNGTDPVDATGVDATGTATPESDATEVDTTESTTSGTEKMDAALRRALRDTDLGVEHQHDVLIAVSKELAEEEGDAFQALQEDLRSAGLTLRSVAGNIITARGTKTAILAAAEDERIVSLQLSGTSTF